MKFKVGQKWQTRDGRVATITTVARDSENYPIGVTIGDDPLEWTYCVEGTPYKGQKDLYDRDLVLLIGDVPDEVQWIEWNGGENPVPGATVEYRMRDLDFSCEDEADLLRWDHEGLGWDIESYRVKKAAPAPEPEPKPEPITITEPGDYVTRDGRKAVVVATNLRGLYPNMGYYGSEDELDRAETWGADGKVYVGAADDPLDIVGRWNPYAGIAIDTPVWVKDKRDAEWVPRHFAEVKHGKPACWGDGLTSHTGHRIGISTWDELSLTKPE